MSNVSTARAFSRPSGGGAVRAPETDTAVETRCDARGIAPSWNGRVGALPCHLARGSRLTIRSIPRGSPRQAVLDAAHEYFSHLHAPAPHLAAVVTRLVMDEDAAQSTGVPGRWLVFVGREQLRGHSRCGAGCGLRRGVWSIAHGRRPPTVGLPNRLESRRAVSSPLHDNSSDHLWRDDRLQVDESSVDPWTQSRSRSWLGSCCP